MRAATPARALRMLAGAVLGAAVVLVVTAGSAAAHPATPSEYRSEVVGVEPPTDAVEVEVVGGDAFIRITVASGHEVVVIGYQDEPYLRIDGGGTVYVNTRSPSHYLNAERYGGVDLPGQADAAAPPAWEEVASGGSVAWHDHRIHWMLPNPPPGVDRGERISEWEVTFLVDGEPVVARGSLFREPLPSPLLPAGVALVGLAAVGLGGRARRAVVVAAVPVAAAAAVWLGWSELTATPPGFEAASLRSFSLVTLPALALLAAAAAAVLWVTSRQRLAGRTVLAAVVVLAFWVVPRLEILWTPILPTSLPATLDRTVFAAVIGVGVAATALMLNGRPMGSRPREAAPHTSAPMEV